MSSADESIQRAKAHENARKILEGMRSPGGYNLFKGEPNAPPMPTARGGGGGGGSIDIGGSPFGGPAPRDMGEPLPGGGGDWLPSGGGQDAAVQQWASMDPMERAKWGSFDAWYNAGMGGRPGPNFSIPGGGGGISS
jgi:hypothetical protein